jgi:putative ABC transport system permease protein
MAAVPPPRPLETPARRAIAAWLQGWRPARDGLLAQAVVEGLRTMRTQRLRTALTLVCVVWGTASVVFLSAWGAGMTQMLERGFEKVGRNLLRVSAGRVGEAFTPAVERRILELTQGDVQLLRRRMRNAELVTAHTDRFSTAAAGARSFSVEVNGVEPATFALRGTALAAGRPLSPGDLAQRRRVAVLGHDAREQLLGAGSAIGRTIRIDGRSFEIVGVLARVGTQLWRGGPTEIDDQIWIPLSTGYTLPEEDAAKTAQEAASVQARTDATQIVDQILVRLPTRQARAAAEAEIRALLAPRLRVSPSDREALRIASPLDLLRNIPLDEARGVLTLIAVMTLLIGGIGVLNLMLESVQERRREIGVRLAVGASQRDIVSQFFVETLVITGSGGLLGIALGSTGVAVLGSLQVPDLIPQPIVEPVGVIVAFVSLCGVGLAAGVLPARRAALIDPSLTLRSE